MRLSTFVRALRRTLLGAFLIGGAWAVVAQTQPPVTPPAPKKAAAPPASVTAGVRPRWNELTAAQREALAPLAGMWETLGPERKRKWLDVAAKYPKLTPDAQQRVHQRMGEFAQLSPEQKTTARENFRRAYELPAIERQEKLQRYQELPDDKKRALADQAAKKQSTPPSQPQSSTTLVPGAAKK